MDHDLEILNARREQDERTGGIPPRVIIFVGIPGSGKTTFAKRLEARCFVHISQDSHADAANSASPRQLLDLLLDSPS